MTLRIVSRSTDFLAWEVSNKSPKGNLFGLTMCLWGSWPRPASAELSGEGISVGKYRHQSSTMTAIRHPKALKDTTIDEFKSRLKAFETLHQALEALNKQIEELVHDKSPTDQVFWRTPIWVAGNHTSHASGTSISALFKHLRDDLRHWNVVHDDKIAAQYQKDGLRLIGTLQTHLTTDETDRKHIIRHALRESLTKVLKVILDNQVDSEQTVTQISDTIWKSALEWTWRSKMYQSDASDEPLRIRALVREQAKVITDSGVVATRAFLNVFSGGTVGEYDSTAMHTSAVRELKSLVGLNGLHYYFMLVAAKISETMPWNEFEAEWCDGTNCNHSRMHRMEPGPGPEIAAGSADAKRDEDDGGKPTRSMEGGDPIDKELEVDVGTSVAWTKEFLEAADNALKERDPRLRGALRRLLQSVPEDFRSKCTFDRTAEFHGTVKHFCQVGVAYLANLPAECAPAGLHANARAHTGVWGPDLGGVYGVPAFGMG